MVATMQPYLHISPELGVRGAALLGLSVVPQQRLPG
jgi:hypothetical protein